MKNTIGRIAVKVTDYKICNRCKSINWYENKKCLNCEETTFKDMIEEGDRMKRNCCECGKELTFEEIESHSDVDSKSLWCDKCMKD